ncbi:hypothetical protein TrLO_g8252 [Triparma laevis f. longispina]|uniref:Uncharacterized protein n=1 Tax=Triparma laevis f. longispina TaxID=1714387 RepID=A0A9W7CJV0_9STRA|nr:hypothetical protein TrLO_g8252 [Triparma laevis f. longispina]
MSLNDAIALINGEGGFPAARYDVVIVCTSDDFQAAYWTRRLTSGLCSPSDSSDSPFPMVLAVSEDWGAGGAGNGLGTLYAFKKANDLAKEKFGVDLTSQLSSSSISAALFHTAGKGTRLAPLPASENNNKPAVRLPATIEVGGEMVPITVLEAVIKQTGVYAPSRMGRLSVFWGDQVFIPSAPTTYSPSHHVDIMCTLGEMVGEAEWKEKGLEKYGVIAVGSDGNAAQVEKVDHGTAIKMLKSLADVEKVGPSLGSFSVSSAILVALTSEFSSELESKAGKLDTDPHFWMPMTLSNEDYVDLMSQKGVEEAVSIAHYARMQRFKESFVAANKTMGVFGAVDVGKDACWWDYGQLKLYSKNNLKILEKSQDAELLRAFLGIDSRLMNSDCGGANIDEVSHIFSSTIKGGDISSSVISSVKSSGVEAQGAILVNVSAKKIKAAPGSIAYNIIDSSEEGITLGEGDVLVGVFDNDGNVTNIRSNVSIDGGKMWNEAVQGNQLSFEALHTANKNSDVTAIEDRRNQMHKDV